MFQSPRAYGKHQLWTGKFSSTTS